MFSTDETSSEWIHKGRREQEIGERKKEGCLVQASALPSNIKRKEASMMVRRPKFNFVFSPELTRLVKPDLRKKSLILGSTQLSCVTDAPLNR